MYAHETCLSVRFPKEKENMVKTGILKVHNKIHFSQRLLHFLESFVYHVNINLFRSLGFCLCFCS